MFEEIIGGVGVVCAALAAYSMFYLVFMFFPFNVRSRRLPAAPAEAPVNKFADSCCGQVCMFGPSGIPRRQDLPRCPGGSASVPSPGFTLSAGTDAKSRNDDHFTQQGTRSADSTEGKAS